MTAMVNKYGFRCVSFIGGIFSSLCLLGVSIAGHFPWLIIINGFCAGKFQNVPGTYSKRFFRTDNLYGPCSNKHRSRFLLRQMEISCFHAGGNWIRFRDNDHATNLVPHFGESWLSNNIRRHGRWGIKVPKKFFIFHFSGFLFLTSVFALFFHPLKATRIIVEEEAVPKVDNSDGTKIQCGKFCWDSGMNNKLIPTTTQVVDRNKIMLDDQSSYSSLEIGKTDTDTWTTTTTGTDSPKKAKKTYCV